MDFFLPLLTFIVSFLSSVLSGMAGLGGGFIMAPYWLLIGMSPAQAVANGSFIALGMGVSSLAAFRKTEHFPRNKNLILILSIIAVAASVIGAIILPHVEAGFFKPILAVVTIFSLPLLFIKRKTNHRTKRHQFIGLLLFTVFILAGSIVFSSGFSILIALVLSTLFNLTVLQGTALRRLVGTVQVVVLFVILAFSGNFIWPHALAGILGGVIGIYIGTKIAIRRGEKFAKVALATGALVSSLALLL